VSSAFTAFMMLEASVCPMGSDGMIEASRYFPLSLPTDLGAKSGYRTVKFQHGQL